MSTNVAITPSLYNAAFSGFCAAKRFQRQGSDGTVADSNSLIAAASTFAAAMDAAAGNAAAPATVVTLVAKLAAGGATVVAASAANFNAAESAPVALAVLCMGYFAGTGLIGTAADTTTATYNPGTAAAPTGAVADILAAFGDMVGGANGMSLL